MIVELPKHINTPAFQIHFSLRTAQPWNAPSCSLPHTAHYHTLLFNQYSLEINQPTIINNFLTGPAEPCYFLARCCRCLAEIAFSKPMNGLASGRPSQYQSRALLLHMQVEDSGFQHYSLCELIPITNFYRNKVPFVWHVDNTLPKQQCITPTDKIGTCQLLVQKP